MRSFFGWTESAAAGSLLVDCWDPEVAGYCASAILSPHTRTRSIGAHSASERKRPRRPGVEEVMTR
jgi:hypothetical protein